MGRKTQVMIGDADKIMSDSEFPSCYECGEPIIYFVHEGGLGYNRMCTNHDCEEGFPRYAENQISGTKVNNCIEKDGVETIKEDIDELKEIIAEKVLPVMEETEPGSEEREEKLAEEGLHMEDT